MDFDFDEEDKPKKVSKPRRFAPCRAGKSKPKPPTIEKVEPPSQSDFLSEFEVKLAVPKIEHELYDCPVQMEIDSKVNKEPELMDMDKILLQKEKEDEEEDVLVRKIDDFFNPKVRVSPTSEVEIDLAMDVHSRNCDSNFGSEPHMTKQMLTTRWKPPPMTDYAIGVLSSNELHLNPDPVDAVAQLKPQMHYLDYSFIDKSIGMSKKQKTVKNKGKQISTYQNSFPEQDWVPLERHGLQYNFSSRYLKGMMANTNSSVDFNMSPEGYVYSLCCGESSKNSETKESSKSQFPTTPVDNRSRVSSSQHMKYFPNDLIMEILLRLPAESIARNRYVSKLWHSILCDTYFMELFDTMSLACPQLLFCVPDGDNLFFFSTPQVGNPDENSFLVSAYRRPISFPFSNPSAILRGPVFGMFSLSHIENMKSNGAGETELVIVNTSTGQSLRLPRVDTGRGMECLVGYDPVDKQFKVLCMTKMVSDSGSFGEYRVLTLGTQNLQWRMIECSEPHKYFKVLSDEICIDGRLYYVGYVDVSKTLRRSIVIVCFDLRSEKFRVVEKGINNAGREMRLTSSSTLVNYKGKLGVLLSNYAKEVTAYCDHIELWVLEDAERHEWSIRVSILPPSWEKVARECPVLFFVGVTNNDEIVMVPQYQVPQYQCLPFFVIYYDMKTKTIRKFEIKGMEKFKNCYVRTYLHHVENVKLMQ